MPDPTQDVPFGDQPFDGYDIDDIYRVLKSRGIKNSDPRLPKFIQALQESGVVKSRSNAGVQSGLTSAYKPAPPPTAAQKAQSLVNEIGFSPGATTPHDSTMSKRAPARPGVPDASGKALLERTGLTRGRVDASKISDAEIFAAMTAGNVIPTLTGLTGGLFGGAGGGFLGGLAGGVAGGAGGAALQNQFMKMGGWSDRDLEELGKRTEQFRKEHPQLAWSAEMLPNLLTGKPVGAGTLKAITSKAGAKAIGKELVKEIPARIGGAAMMGGIGTAQRKIQGAPVDASTVASDMAGGFFGHGANQNWVDRNFGGEVGKLPMPSLRRQKPSPTTSNLETLFSDPRTKDLADGLLSRLHDPGLDETTKMSHVADLNAASGENKSLGEWMGIGLNRGVEQMAQTSEVQRPRPPMPPLNMDENGNIPLFDPLAPGMQGDSPLNTTRQLNLLDDNTVGPKPVIDPSLPVDPEIAARQSRVPQNEESNSRITSALSENEALVSRLTDQLASATTTKAKARISRQIHDALESGRLLRQQFKYEDLSGRPGEESVVSDLVNRRRAKEAEQATPVRQEPVVPLSPVRTPEPVADLSPGRAPIAEDAPTPFDPAQAAIDAQTSRAKVTAQAYDLYKGAYGTNRKGLESERIRQTKIMTGNGSAQAKANAAINRAALDRLIDETPDTEPTPQPRAPKITQPRTSEPVVAPKADDLAPGKATTEPTPRKTRTPKAAPTPKSDALTSEDMTPVEVASATVRANAVPDLAPGQVTPPRTPVAPTRTAPAEGEVAPGRLASAAKATAEPSKSQEGHLPGQKTNQAESPVWESKGVRKRLTKVEREAQEAAEKAKREALLEQGLASFKEREAARKKAKDAESEEYVAKQLAKLPDSALVNPEKFKSDAPGQADASKKKVDDGPAKPGDTVKFPVGKNDKGETVYREGVLSSGGTEKSVVSVAKDASGIARKIEVPSGEVEVVSRKQAQTSETGDISSPSRGDGSHYIERDPETGQHFLHRTKDDKTPIPDTAAKKIASILSRFPTKNPRDAHDLSTGMARSMGSTPLDPSIDNSGKVVRVWNGSEMTLAVVRRLAPGRPSSSPRNINLHQPAWLESVWKAYKGEDSFLPDTPDWLPHDEVVPYGTSLPTLERAFDRTKTRLGIENPTPDSSKPIQTDKGIPGVQAPTLKMQVFRETKMGTPTRDLADHLDIPVVDPSKNRSGDDTARLFPGSKVELTAWATTKTAFKNPRMNKEAIDTIKGQVIDISKSEGSNTGFAIVKVLETAKLNDGAVIPAGTKISLYIGDSPEGHVGFTMDNVRRVETMDSKGRRGMMLVDDKPLGSKVQKGVWVSGEEAAFHKAETLEAQTSESKKFIEETLKRSKKEMDDSC
jgi:hypothetical protein